MQKLFDIAGKRAIVTGASRGLGRGIAEGFLEVGAKVAMMARSEALDEAGEQYRAMGYDARAIRGDLSKRDEIARMYEEAIAYLGGVDILVTAAGIQRRNRSDQFVMDDWDRVIEMNLTGVFILSQLCARRMMEQGSGKIIHIASMISWFGGINIPAYAASKGGIAQLTKAMGNDLAPFGIQVNAIAPGYMRTDMNENLLKDESRMREITGRIPMGRWGEIEDMKGAAIFLASSASDYMSGVILPVDGGYLAR